MNSIATLLSSKRKQQQAAGARAMLNATVTAVPSPQTTSPYQCTVQIDGATSTNTALISNEYSPAVGDRVVVNRIGSLVVVTLPLIATAFDTGWQTPTLNADFQSVAAPFGPVQYRRLNGIVYMRGLLQNKSTTTSQGALVTAFTLPAGFLPAEDIYSAALVEGYVSNYITVQTTGTVVVGANLGPSIWISLADVPPWIAEA
jgi:hypothetical protein